MKLYKILVPLILLIGLPAEAQTTVAEIDITKVLDLEKILEMHQSVNEETGDYCIFMLNNEAWTAVLFDKDSNFQQKLNIKRSTSSGFNEVTHTYFDGEKFNILFEGYNHIDRVSFNFKNHSISEESIAKPKGISSFFAHFQHNNSYYFLGLEQYKSDLHFVILDAHPEFKLKTSSLPNEFPIFDESFMLDLEKKEALKKVLDYHGIRRLETIYSGEEVSMNQAGSPAKIFVEADQIKITLDLSRDYTTLITTSLSTFESNIQLFPYNNSSIFDRKVYSHNSYILGDSLYQLKAYMKSNFVIPGLNLNKSTPSKLKIQITELKNGAVVKSFLTSNEEEKVDWIFGPFVSRTSKKPRKFKRYITDEDAYIMVAHLVHNDPIIFPEYNHQGEGINLFVGFTVIEKRHFKYKTTNANPLIRSFYHTNVGKHFTSEIKLENDLKTPFNNNIFYQIKDYIELLNKNNFQIDTRKNVTILSTENIPHLVYYNQNDNTLRIVQF